MSEEVQIVKNVKIIKVEERKTKTSGKIFWVIKTSEGDLSTFEGGLIDLINKKCLGKTCDLGLVQKGAYMNLNSIEEIHEEGFSTAEKFHKAMTQPTQYQNHHNHFAKFELDTNPKLKLEFGNWYLLYSIKNLKTSFNVFGMVFLKLLQCVVKQIKLLVADQRVILYVVPILVESQHISQVFQMKKGDCTSICGFQQ
jgi:hypothetical protein